MLSLSEPWGQTRILGYLRGLSEVGQNLSNAYHWCILVLGFVNDTGKKKKKMNLLCDWHQNSCFPVHHLILGYGALLSS